MRKTRPLSPHLTIYKPQISSVLSIFHRITGIFLFFGLLFLSWILVSLMMQSIGVVDESNCIYDIINSRIFKAILLGIIFCLYYHLLNGIRHLVWDVGLGFEKRTMNISGMVVLLLWGLMTFITLILVSIKGFGL
jgi:succinate dehydrogenase / fumarate reductase, cytochrome b subunit